MKNRASKTSVLLLVIFLSGMPASFATETSKVPLKEKMQHLYQSLSELLTDVCSEQLYFDPKNSSRIEREIKNIMNFSHEIGKNSEDKGQSDLTVPLLAGFLTEQTNEAYRSFKAGQKGYARDILRSIPANCIACHSRNQKGADFVSLPLEPKSPLTLLEKAEFFAATRQFDRASESFLKVIRGQEKIKTVPYDLEKAIHESLSIAVRFKRDPVLAQSILQSALANPDAPQFIKEDVETWKKSVEGWAAESVHSAQTEEGMYAEAQRLITEARAKQTYSMDHSGDILYLRASSLLYDLIQIAPQGKHLADALLLLGMSYEVLNPRRMQSLHNIYYEVCIKKAPHTDTARACYKRYEQSMYVGFTGSSGTHLPDDIKQKLLELWTLAMKIKGNL